MLIASGNPIHAGDSEVDYSSVDASGNPTYAGDSEVDNSSVDASGNPTYAGDSEVDNSSVDASGVDYSGDGELDAGNANGVDSSESDSSPSSQVSDMEQQRVVAKEAASCGREKSG